MLPILNDFFDTLSTKMLSLPCIILTAVGIGLILRPAFSVVPWAIAAFVPALALAFVVRFLVEWSLALAAFWTTRVGAINQMYFVLLLFLSGQMAPLSLMPDWIQAAAAVLPFRWMIAFPIELLLGRLTPAETLTGFAAQAIWILFGLGLVRIVWRAGVRTYSAVGA